MAATAASDHATDAGLNAAAHAQITPRPKCTRCESARKWRFRPPRCQNRVRKNRSSRAITAPQHAEIDTPSPPVRARPRRLQLCMRSALDLAGASTRPQKPPSYRDGEDN
ncbi:Hypothetical protein H16_B2388 [Cupriavidus necator H16]|uniref:Uncharacterized protein n=1 Tax=Cupriavidus necator (strain ATCC 17699 / DSM 428 / KCTC 22496 / NCIMB 10442 / H16 / Stanier 337) TaxID=381666 RepID=Q0JYK4_CUPNH|nr:Hypothetical protein H16_B2388 [Cupriavidus necator H16]